MHYWSLASVRGKERSRQTHVLQVLHTFCTNQRAWLCQKSALLVQGCSLYWPVLNSTDSTNISSITNMWLKSNFNVKLNQLMILGITKIRGLMLPRRNSALLWVLQRQVLAGDFRGEKELRWQLFNQSIDLLLYFRSCWEKFQTWCGR